MFDSTAKLRKNVTGVTLKKLFSCDVLFYLNISDRKQKKAICLW